MADPGRWPKLAALRRRLEADPAVVYASGLERGEPAKGNGSCRGHVDLATLVERFETDKGSVDGFYRPRCLEMIHPRLRFHDNFR